MVVDLSVNRSICGILCRFTRHWRRPDYRSRAHFTIHCAGFSRRPHHPFCVGYHDGHDHFYVGRQFTHPPPAWRRELAHREEYYPGYFSRHLWRRDTGRIDDGSTTQRYLCHFHFLRRHTNAAAISSQSTISTPWEIRPISRRQCHRRLIQLGCNRRRIVVRAIGTAAAIGFPIALAGTAGYIANGFLQSETLPDLSLGYVYLPALAWLVSASMLTAPLGAKLTHSTKTATLRTIFVVLLYGLGIRMLITIL